MSIQYLDPNETIKDFRTSTTNTDENKSDEDKNDTMESNFNQWNNMLSRRTILHFMDQKRKLNKHVTDTQIIEFLHEYVEGTRVSPWAHFLSTSAEEAMMDHIEEVPSQSAATAGTSNA